MARTRVTCIAPPACPSLRRDPPERALPLLWPSRSNQAPLTCRTGALLLRGEWREAVRAIMAGRADERHEATAARRAYLDRGDVHAALGGIHHNAVAERAILEVRSIW